MKYFVQNLRAAKAALRSVEPFEILRNMGFRYVAFRLWFAFQRHSGLLKIRFPKRFDEQKFITLAEWRCLPIAFFFDKPALLSGFSQSSSHSLKNRVENLHDNKFLYFSSEWHSFTDWHTHPETGFRYDADQHWSEIPDFSVKAGDIKYIWEISRFSFLYDLIRYDFHFQEDQSLFVFAKIENWIDHNPVNCGPNWKCSQEIALRVLNWTFALHYYKHSAYLNEERFTRIITSIYRQMQHVEENIHFSKIAVRNNHVLTETLSLYLMGLLYPIFPESARWKKNGKKWFENEVAFQIEENGTFLQFSMNYHRIVVQLFTWAIGLAERNGEQWGDVIYDLAKQSLYFLRTCQDDRKGWLPNFGNNDGALFFPLTESHFRDFRPQLAALAGLLNIDPEYEPGDWEEESAWFNVKKAAKCPEFLFQSGSSQCFSFSKGGYYVLRDAGTTTFIRCGSHNHRPFQADNLHLDIWVDGENILRDAGSYRYNTDEIFVKYFTGTASHNTVMLGDYDQMRKGPGFIWYEWITRATGEWKSTENENVFNGCFEGFKHLGSGIIHHRKILKRTGESYWEIEDRIENAPHGLVMKQLWHPSETFFEKYSIQAFDESGGELVADVQQGWNSDFYGKKQDTKYVKYSSAGRFIRTIIQKKQEC